MLFTAEKYRSMREEYCYCDRDCRFQIEASTFLDSKFIGECKGIFPKTAPPHYSNGINLRRFEIIVQAVFAAASHAESDNAISPTHVANLKEIICAVVH